MGGFRPWKRKFPHFSEGNYSFQRFQIKSHLAFFFSGYFMNTYMQIELFFKSNMCVIPLAKESAHFISMGRTWRKKKKRNELNRMHHLLFCLNNVNVTVGPRFIYCLLSPSIEKVETSHLLAIPPHHQSIPIFSNIRCSISRKRESISNFQRRFIKKRKTLVMVLFKSPRHTKCRGWEKLLLEPSRRNKIAP